MDHYLGIVYLCEPQLGSSFLRYFSGSGYLDHMQYEPVLPERGRASHTKQEKEPKQKHGLHLLILPCGRQECLPLNYHAEIFWYLEACSILIPQPFKMCLSVCTCIIPPVIFGDNVHSLQRWLIYILHSSVPEKEPVTVSSMQECGRDCF